MVGRVARELLAEGQGVQHLRRWWRLVPGAAALE
jgi:hypothetical protein